MPVADAATANVSDPGTDDAMHGGILRGDDNDRNRATDSDKLQSCEMRYC